MLHLLLKLCHSAMICSSSPSSPRSSLPALAWPKQWRRGLVTSSQTKVFSAVYSPKDFSSSFLPPPAHSLARPGSLLNLMCVPLLTIISLITGIIFIRHRSLLKTFLIHPSLLLLPAFAFFTFESNRKCCKCNNRDSQNEVEITFSVKATCLNILFSLATLIVFTFTRIKHDCWNEIPIIPLPSILLTVILLLTTSSFSCSCSCSSPSDSCSAQLSSCSYCSPTSTSSFCYPPLQFGIYLPDSPCKVFVKDQTQPNGRREFKDMGEENEEEVNMDEEGEGNERTREMNEEGEVSDFTDCKR